MRIFLVFRFDLDSERLYKTVEAVGLDTMRQLRFLFQDSRPEVSIAFAHPLPTQDAPVGASCTFYRKDGSRDCDSTSAFTGVVQAAANRCYDDYADAALRRSAACRAAAAARWANDD